MMLDALFGGTPLDALVEGSHHGGDANSQVTGSNVLIYTEGDADMTFALSFPTERESSTKDYVIHPSYCVSLGAGTLLIFSPVDDVFFCHEAFFLQDSSGTHRLAFVFRWLTAPRVFYVRNRKHKLSQRLRDQAGEREDRKRRNREADAMCAFTARA